MSTLLRYVIATYFSKVCISFPHKLAFWTAILIFFVFLFESIFVVIKKWQMMGLCWRKCRFRG